MDKTGLIIIIEDDVDDKHLLTMVFKDLAYPNRILFFDDGEKALEYLHDDTVHPFMILSDINMPKLSGLELRKLVHTSERLSAKCIPYLFFSTAVEKKAVEEAYKMSVQGFFKKPMSYERFSDTMRKIIEYWQECYSPNQF